MGVAFFVPGLSFAAVVGVLAVDVMTADTGPGNCIFAVNLRHIDE